MRNEQFAGYIENLDFLYFWEDPPPAFVNKHTNLFSTEVKNMCAPSLFNALQN